MKSLGFAARSWELLDGPHGDLTSPKVLRQVLADIRSGRAVAGMLAPPCSSFSCARDRTAVIRTRLEPWGVSGEVSPKDAERLEVGNSTARSAIVIAKAFHKKGLPWIIENPHSSKIWWLPPMLELASLSGVEAVVTDFCMFARPWRKRTLLLCGNIKEEDRARLCRRCSGTRGFCSRTGQRHLQLTGSAPCGTPWTRIAQPYPPALCKQLAFVLTEGYRERFMNKCSA